MDSWKMWLGLPKSLNWLTSAGNGLFTLLRADSLRGWKERNNLLWGRQGRCGRSPCCHRVRSSPRGWETDDKEASPSSLDAAALREEVEEGRDRAQRGSSIEASDSQAVQAQHQTCWHEYVLKLSKQDLRSHGWRVSKEQMQREASAAKAVSDEFGLI